MVIKADYLKVGKFSYVFTVYTVY